MHFSTDFVSTVSIAALFIIWLRRVSVAAPRWAVWLRAGFSPGLAGGLQGARSVVERVGAAALGLVHLSSPSRD